MRDTGGMGTLPIHVPNGFLIVSPSTATPSTGYDGPSDTWTTYQKIAVGATGLADISLISVGVAQLPANAGVSFHCWHEHLARSEAHSGRQLHAPLFCGSFMSGART